MPLSDRWSELPVRGIPTITAAVTMQVLLGSIWRVQYKFSVVCVYKWIDLQHNMWSKWHFNHCQVRLHRQACHCSKLTRAWLRLVETRTNYLTPGMQQIPALHLMAPYPKYWGPQIMLLYLGCQPCVAPIYVDGVKLTRLSVYLQKPFWDKNCSTNKQNSELYWQFPSTSAVINILGLTPRYRGMR